RVRGRTQGASKERQPSAPSASAEKMLLISLLQGRVPADAAARIHEELFEDPTCKTLFSIIKTDLDAGEPIDFAGVATHLRGEAELTLLSELTLSADVDEATLRRIDENLRPLERNYLERRKLQIQRDIVEADRNGDEGRVAELLAEKARISSSLK
ncbi:MAG: DnaB-like helicase N-terminal domain-containing protein, partial [Thermoanaerobaculia bacterium]